MPRSRQPRCGRVSAAIFAHDNGKRPSYSIELCVSSFDRESDEWVNKKIYLAVSRGRSGR